MSYLISLWEGVYDLQNKISLVLFLDLQRYQVKAWNEVTSAASAQVSLTIQV